MRLRCGKVQGRFHDFRDTNPSRAPRAEGGAGTSRAGPDGRDKRDPPAVGRPRRGGPNRLSIRQRKIPSVQYLTNKKKQPSAIGCTSYLTNRGALRIGGGFGKLARKEK